jgi:hypothetical protein
VAPPSLHPEGTRYHWSPQGDAVSLAPLPQWMLDQARNGQQRNGVVVCQGLPDQVGPGQRNESLYRLGRSLSARLSGAAVAAALLAENQVRCVPPLTEAEVHEM